MERLIAVGDIHGRLNKLEGIIEQIAPQAEDRIVFLGDYIDRGPDSYQVVEYLARFKKDFPNAVTLRGNHEDFVISLLMGNLSEAHRNIWLKMNGGQLTWVSYKRADSYLAEHKDFYMSLQHSWENDTHFFCHAGIRPGVPFAEQRKVDLIEIGEPFLSSERDHGKVIVHGHTVAERPVILPNRIGIDTGAGIHGPLTAVELPSLKIWQQF